MFTGIDSNKLKLDVGVFFILLVIYRRSNIKKILLDEKGMLLGGELIGFISGLAESAGHLGAAFLPWLSLTATVYIASEAFTALKMHITKITFYNKYALVRWTELYYGIFISVEMILGSWTGKKIIEKLSREKFILLVEILPIMSCLQLIFWTVK